MSACESASTRQIGHMERSFSLGTVICVTQSRVKHFTTSCVSMLSAPREKQPEQKDFINSFSSQYLLYNSRPAVRLFKSALKSLESRLRFKMCRIREGSTVFSAGEMESRYSMYFFSSNVQGRTGYLHSIHRASLVAHLLKSLQEILLPGSPLPLLIHSTNVA